MRSIVRFIILLIFTSTLLQVHAQGISANPPRMYFTQRVGLSGSQRLHVINPSNQAVNIGVSIGDWNYDSVGNNKMYEAGTLKTSCAKWLQILPGSYFTLQPGQEQTLTINMNVPADADTGISVHTAMLYLTQLNASDGKARNGAAIKVRVQMGVKIYHSFSAADTKGMEIANFQDTTHYRKR